MECKYIMCDGHSCTDEGHVEYEGKFYCAAHALTILGGSDPIYNEGNGMEFFGVLTRPKRTRAKKPTPARAKPTGVKKFKPYKIKRFR
jgi:hypothetical protein